jgi:hypothetical protein
MTWFPWLLTAIIGLKWAVGSSFLLTLVADTTMLVPLAVSHITFAYPGIFFFLVLPELFKSTDALVIALREWREESGQDWRFGSFWTPFEGGQKTSKQGGARTGLCLLEVERPWVEGGADLKWCLGAVYREMEEPLFYPLPDTKLDILEAAKAHLRYIKLERTHADVGSHNRAIMAAGWLNKHALKVANSLKRWLRVLKMGGYLFGSLAIVLVGFFHSEEALSWILGLYGVGCLLLALFAHVYSRDLVKRIRVARTLYRTSETDRVAWQEFDYRHPPQGLCLLEMRSPQHRSGPFLSGERVFSLAYVATSDGVPRVQPANWLEFHKERTIGDKIARCLWLDEAHPANHLQAKRCKTQEHQPGMRWSPV